jgi:23S rRNA (guanosine2251-2'-O)-methyltransferase
VARRGARRLLVVPQRRQALERLVLHATNLRIPVVEVEGGTLTAVAGFDGHQGIALVVEPRTWASPDEILARAVERGEPPFVLILDSLEDPQNVGTLLRSAEAAGIHGVVFPTHHQAPLTPAAVKASAGAVEHLLLCPVDDLPTAMSDLRLRGLRIAAAEADAPLTATEADLRGPLAIVVGSEGSGLSPAVRRRADLAIRIPMRGAIGSLNAAVAGSILLFAALAQRDPGATSEPPAAAAEREWTDRLTPDPKAAEALPAPDAQAPPAPDAEAPPAIEGAPVAVDDEVRGVAAGAAEPETPSGEAAASSARRRTAAKPPSDAPAGAEKKPRKAAGARATRPSSRRTTAAEQTADDARDVGSAPSDDSPVETPPKPRKARSPRPKAPAKPASVADDDLLPGGPAES